MQSLSAAFKYLTIWGFFAVQPAAESIGSGAIFFPLAGLAVGLTLAISSYLLAPYLHPELLSVTLIAVLILTTGGRHLEGLRRTFADGITNSVRQASRQNEGLGFAAILMTIIFKITAANGMDERLASSLLVTPIIARWALVLFFHGYDTRLDETGRLIAKQIRPWHLLVTTLATLAVAVYFSGRKGLWIGLVLSLLALITRSLIHRRRGVVTHDHGGTVVEFGEALGLVLLASL